MAEVLLDAELIEGAAVTIVQRGEELHVWSKCHAATVEHSGSNPIPFCSYCKAVVTTQVPTIALRTEYSANDLPRRIEEWVHLWTTLPRASIVVTVTD